MPVKSNCKKIFILALNDLCQEKDFQDITVKDILQQSGLSRSTFYRYFHDKYDLMCYYYEYYLEENCQPVYETKDSIGTKQYKISLNSTTFFYENREIIGKFLCYDGQNAFREYTYQNGLRHFRRLCRLAHKEIDPMLDFAIRYHCGAYRDIIVYWLKKDCPILPQDLCLLMHNSMPEILKELFVGLKIPSPTVIVSKEEIKKFMPLSQDNQGHKTKKSSSTKKLLASALYKLSQNKKVEDITIDEILEFSGISRATFYRHFQDKYDLMTYYYITYLSEMYYQLGKNEYTPSEFQRLVALKATNFYYEHPKYIHSLSKGTRHSAFAKKVLEYGLTHYSILLSCAKVADLPIELHFVIYYHCFGANFMLSEWFGNKFSYTPEEHCEMLYKTMPQMLKEALG